MAFEIKNPGLATTVQDQGRTGYYNVGIPQSGSMDQYSAELGNALVGNGPGDAVLECTYLGPVLVTDAEAVIAITGAPVEVKVNGEAKPQWTRASPGGRRRTQLRSDPGRHPVLHRRPGWYRRP